MGNLSRVKLLLCLLLQEIKNFVLELCKPSLVVGRKKTDINVCSLSPILTVLEGKICLNYC